MKRKVLIPLFVVCAILLNSMCSVVFAASENAMVIPDQTETVSEPVETPVEEETILENEFPVTLDEEDVESTDEEIIEEDISTEETEFISEEQTQEVPETEEAEATAPETPAEDVVTEAPVVEEEIEIPEDATEVESVETPVEEEIETPSVAGAASLLMGAPILMTSPLPNAVEVPTLAAANDWYTGSTAKSTFTTINIVNTVDESTAETATESWAADDDGSGDIMCYVNGTTLTIAGNGSEKIMANTNSARAFRQFSNATCINGLELLDTSNVTDMGHMFGGCSALTSLDVSNFDTSNVTNMSNMFWECYALTTLDASNFNTSSATTMSGMFHMCVKLTSLNVSNFDTSNVTDMGHMFSHCGALTSLDVSNFDTSSVTNMRQMFYCCHSLTELDLSNWNTEKTTRLLFSNFAANCENLTTIILGENFGQTANLPSAGASAGMFYLGSPVQTTVSGANDVMKAYNWAKDGRIATSNAVTQNSASESEEEVASPAEEPEATPENETSNSLLTSTPSNSTIGGTTTTPSATTSTGAGSTGSKSERGNSGGSSVGGSSSSAKVEAVVEKEVNDAEPVVEIETTEEVETMPEKIHVEYTDVSTEHWAAESIYSVTDKGIMAGDGTGYFFPEEHVTREEMAKIIIKAFDITVENATSTFEDVEMNMWYAEYINIAVSAGLMQGKSETEFGIGDVMTRQDTAVIIHRFFSEKEHNFNTVEIEVFTDEAEIADYAKEAVQFVQKHQIMVGTDGAFNPNQPLTRAMAAQIICNLISE